ncbi:MAG: sigma-70 family RNA polymerase sigma factor [Clostridia bacterium]|nr:sigma-70 family RNA polymerase sigma factor [Clostridia bacterium]
MKTIEELASEIQAGDKSLIPELWGRVQRLYLRKSFDYYGSHRVQCDRAGVTVEDIQQQAFFAFLKSVEAYEPQCELSFSSYIKYPFLNEMQELTRTRTSGQRQDVLCSSVCSSLDREIDNEDGSSNTIGDFVPDPDALYFIELIDDQSAGEMVRAEVRKLPEPVCTVIQLFFFAGQTLGQIADKLGITPQRVQQQKQRGLVELSRRRVLIDLWNETHYTSRLRDLESAAKKAESLDARRQYERAAERTAPRKPSRIDAAFRYAAEMRERSGKTFSEWTAAEQTAAVMEYLQQHPATA